MKPQPKAELVVTHYNGDAIKISAVSPDAFAWASREAAAYGDVVPFSDGRTILLYVAPNFDAAEVAAYLRSYSHEEA